MTLLKPPKPGDFRAGQQLFAGLGKATVLPDTDYETYSEAGYLWNEAKRSWDRLPGSGSKKKGLSTVGVAAYSEHPTADVLLAVFDLKDGQGAERWRPGMPVPPRWRAHVESGGLVEAHNAPFEAWMNRNILVPHYGFPVVQDWQWRCSMAKCRAWSMPPSLGEVGDVLNIRSKKDKDGERLMGIFSWPRKPTKADPRTRILPSDDPVNFERYADYNQRDIEAEAEVSRAVPDLMPVEQEYWMIDFRINQRGVYVDRAGMDNCIDIIEQAHERYNTELSVLTGGAVTKASELQKLVGWMGAYKLFATSLDEENVDAWLERIEKAERSIADFEAANVASPQTAIDPYLEFDDIYQITDLPRVKRALEIRREVGSAAVKKVFAMRCQLTRDDRLHDLFTFHGARTGRPTGSGPQPTNMPNSGPEVYCCADCKRYFPVAMGKCGTCGGKPAARCKVCKQYVSGPSCCGVVRSPKPYAAEWSAEAAESALEAIATRSLEYVELVWGDAMPTVSGCLRGLYTAAPGHDLIGSDYSAIEAVVNAALSGEKWRMEVFRTHGKIYEASAAATFKVPLDEILAYQKSTGNKHPLRFKGKVTELACFTAETRVLTPRGYVAIVDVLNSDKVWDGIEWVSHRGLVPRGVQSVLRLDGVEMTPTHKVLCGTSWLEASQLASNGKTLSLSLATGSANLPLSARCVLGPAGTLTAYAAAARHLGPRSATSRRGDPPAAGTARRRQLAQLVEESSAVPFPNFQNAVSTLASTLRSIGATTLNALGSRTTAVAGFLSTVLGAKVARLFWPTSLLSKGGIHRASTWTGSTTTAITNLETCDSSLALTTWQTVDRSGGCNDACSNLKPVYDLALAGPRSRFTIKTDSGHLIVHNCGYLGWIGALRQIGYAGSDGEAKELIIAWQKASPAIVHLGGGQYVDKFARHKVDYLHGLEGMAVACIRQPNKSFPVLRLDGTPSGLTMITYNDVMYMILPDGTKIAYHHPRLHNPTDNWRGMGISFEGYNTNPKAGPFGWITMHTYGGRLLENACQAVANRILRFGQVQLEAAGYPIVLHVYDENVCEVPHGFGSVEEMERIMSIMPAWACDDVGPWPIKANGGWRGLRYRK